MRWPPMRDEGGHDGQRFYVQETEEFDEGCWG